jgi:hypothetical protein
MVTRAIANHVKLQLGWLTYIDNMIFKCHSTLETLSHARFHGPVA